MKTQLGIEEIGSYIPNKTISNYTRKDVFEIDNHFIEEKIGVKQVARKEGNENTSDMCVKAFQNLEKKQKINISEIECIILVTQNPDTNLPHTAGIVHGKLDVPTSCASFDISLGCSGYVYALSVIQSFMESNNLKKGLLFTCDPYSKVVDMNDKNTSLLFGDAATVTLISDSPKYKTGAFTFGTIGKKYEDLICTNGLLYMNGRGIFNFAAKYIPKDINLLLEKNNISKEKIDAYLFHQGSKYLLDTLVKRMKIDSNKAPFITENYGNTVSSSIPLLIEREMNNSTINKTYVLSGFGVGLSWSSTILYKQ